MSEVIRDSNQKQTNPTTCSPAVIERTPYLRVLGAAQIAKLRNEQQAKLQVSQLGP